MKSNAHTSNSSKETNAFKCPEMHMYGMAWPDSQIMLGSSRNCSKSKSDLHLFLQRSLFRIQNSTLNHNSPFRLLRPCPGNLLVPPLLRLEPLLIFPHLPDE